MKEEDIYKIASELLEKIDTSASAANEIVNNYTKSHKYIEAESPGESADLSGEKGIYSVRTDL